MAGSKGGKKAAQKKKKEFEAQRLKQKERGSLERGSEERGSEERASEERASEERASEEKPTADELGLPDEIPGSTSSVPPPPPPADPVVVRDENTPLPSNANPAARPLSARRPDPQPAAAKGSTPGASGSKGPPAASQAGPEAPASTALAPPPRTAAAAPQPADDQSKKGSKQLKKEKAALDLGVQHLGQGREDEAMAEFARVLAWTGERGAATCERANTLMMTAQIHLQRGNLQDALHDCDLCIRCFEEVGGQEPGARAELEAKLSGDMDKVVPELMANQRLGRALDCLLGVANCKVVVSEAMFRMGQVGRARENAQAALEQLQRIGDKAGSAKATVALAFSHITEDRDTALQHLDQAVELYKEVGDKRKAAETMVLKGRLMQTLAEPERGETPPQPPRATSSAKPQTAKSAPPAKAVAPPVQIREADSDDDEDFEGPLAPSDVGQAPIPLPEEDEDGAAGPGEGADADGGLADDADELYDLD